MPNRIAVRAAVAVLALTLALTGHVVADSVSADADVVTSGSQGLINLGTVAPGSGHALDVGFDLVCTGTSHVAVGTTMTLTATPTPPSGGAIGVTNASIGPVPPSWPANGDPCVDDPVYHGATNSHVTLTAPQAAGANYVYRITYARSPGGGTSGTTLVQILLSVEENTAPELDLPGDMTKEGNTTGGWTAAFDATATDAQDDPDPSVSCSVSQGDVLPLGDTTVDCHATDTGGLATNGSFTVHVVDTTPPDLGALPAPSVSTTEPSGTAVAFATPSATDTVDPSPTVACDPPSGSTFPIGTTPVTCTATDASGNQASGSFDVAVTLETPPNTAPELDLPGDMTKEGNTTGGWTAAFDATATDAQDDPDPSVSCSVSQGDVLPLGDTTVDCHATDTGGLATNGSFTVHVVDTTPPDLGALPAPSVSTTEPSGTAVAFATPSATDTVDPSPTVACDPPSGSTFPIGTTPVTCTATDASGNQASGSFDVAVTLETPPNTAPELDLPGDMTKEGNTTGGWTAAFDATATDAQDDPDPSVSCSVSQGDVLPLGDTTVDCHATDTGGLATNGSFTVHVVDTTPPDLGALPAPSVSTTEPSGTAVAFATPSATDTVDPSPTVACDPPSGSTFPIGTTPVTCTATDASGNQASGSFDVAVTLETPPADARASFDEPLGDGWTTARLGRSMPVKVQVRVDGEPLGPGTGHGPELRADGLDRCAADAAVTASIALGRLTWSSGRWVLGLDTGLLGAGCWRLVVLVDGTDAGAAGLRLVEQGPGSSAASRRLDKMKFDKVKFDKAMPGKGKAIKGR